MLTEEKQKLGFDQINNFSWKKSGSEMIKILEQLN